ncbi:hypothetical protein IF2G_10406 [Cordyceps javanica]|nr:hypothetical protein IF2G_10406 [Cordyceps javanica]
MLPCNASRLYPSHVYTAPLSYVPVLSSSRCHCLQSNSTSSVLPHVEHALAAAKDKEALYTNTAVRMVPEMATPSSGVGSSLPPTNSSCPLRYTMASTDRITMANTDTTVLGGRKRGY